VGAHLCFATGPGRFGEPAYWEATYAKTGSPKEWFLPAEVAATAAATAFALSRKHKRRSDEGAVRVLHVGCGVSRLGSGVAKALAEICGVRAATVLNVDCSDEALRALEALDAGDSAQRYARWDLARGPPPETTDETFDLVLDKGTLDALQFAGSDALCGYFATVRRVLEKSGGLYVHWSDDAPEMKAELLEAGFYHSSDDRDDDAPHVNDNWRVSWVEEETPSAASSSSSSPWGWTYYRYTVSAEDS